MPDPPGTQWLRQGRWTPQEIYMYQHHFNNLRKGGVRNDDGSISTYRSIGVGINGRYYMLPTVWDNQILEDEEAIKRAHQAGIENFPSYESEEEGENRYQQLHDFMSTDMLHNWWK